MINVRELAVARDTRRVAPQEGPVAVVYEEDVIAPFKFDERKIYSVRLEVGADFVVAKRDYEEQLENMHRLILRQLYGGLETKLMTVMRHIYDQDQDKALEVLREIQQEIT